MAILRVGVIGCGYWGPNIIRNLHELDTTEVACVADLDESRLQSIRQIFPGVSVTTDYHDLLDDDVDAVVVATPVSTHHSIAIEAMRRGKHVLVEKPLADSVKHARELVNLAEEEGLRLMVGHVFEYNPAVEHLRDIIQSGELGDIYYIDAVRATLGLFQQDINVIWDLAPHDFSILRYILGMEPTSISARGEAYIRKNIHDVAYITAVFPHAVQAHIRVSWLEPQKQRHMTVVGSKKMVVYDDVQPVEKLKIFDVGVDLGPTGMCGSGRLLYRYGDIVSPRIKQIEPLQAEIRHFVDAVVQRQEPRSSGRVGLSIVRMLETANASLLDDGSVHALTADTGFGTRGHR